MALPLTAVIGGLITAWLAVESNDGMVEDDYYKQGLAINQTLNRDAVAQSLALKGSLVQASANVDLQLTGNIQHYPEQLKLLVLHPTRAGHDQTVMLHAVGAGHYIAREVLPARGRWHLILEDAGETWRLLGEWHGGLPGETRLLVRDGNG
jgi:hypothetical protein